MDNNPIYSALLATLIVFSLFFIIIGNIWAIESKTYSMSNPYEGYLQDDFGNFEYNENEFYATPQDEPPLSLGKITGKMVETYGTQEINSQIWTYNYENEDYKIVGYDEIRTPVDTYVNYENKTNPTYILNQDVVSMNDILVYVNNELVDSNEYDVTNVITTLNETLEINDDEIRVDSNYYFLINNDDETSDTFIIGNEKIDCDWKSGDIDFVNCERGIEGTTASQHEEGTLVIQPGKRMLSMNIPVLRDEEVRVVHPTEYYYNDIFSAQIPTIINSVDYYELNNTYDGYNVFTGEDSSREIITDNVHMIINISQLCFTLSMFLLIFIFFKVKIQFIDSESFRTWALIFGVLGTILSLSAGGYFLGTWTNAFEEDTKLFETNELDSSIWGDGRYEYSVNFTAYTYQICERERDVQNSQYGHLDNGQPSTNDNCDNEKVGFEQQKYNEYTWKLTTNWFIITIIIPLLGLLCLYLISDLDVNGYYSSITNVDALDEFMIIPDHSDGYHVNFAEALGYGFSVLANWITYIIAIAIINLSFFIIIMWVILQSTISSMVITAILSFIGFLLNAALFMAVLYKYQSDVGMKSSESIVTEGFQMNYKEKQYNSSYSSSLPRRTVSSPIVKETTNILNKTKKKGKIGTKNNPELPQTDEEYEEVPKGKYYVNPSDGITYKKE